MTLDKFQEICNKGAMNSQLSDPFIKPDKGELDPDLFAKEPVRKLVEDPSRTIHLKNKDILNQLRKSNFSAKDVLVLHAEPEKKKVETEFSPEFSKALANKLGLDFESHDLAFEEGSKNFEPIQELVEKGLEEFESTGSFHSLITELLNFEHLDGIDPFSLLESSLLYHRKNSSNRHVFKKLEKHFVNFSTAIADLAVSETKETFEKNYILKLYCTFFLAGKKGLEITNNEESKNYCEEIVTQDPDHLFHIILFFPSFYSKIKNQEKLKNYFLDELSSLLFREINAEFSFSNILTNPVFFPIWNDWAKKHDSEIGNPKSEIVQAFSYLIEKNTENKGKLEKHFQNIITNRKVAKKRKKKKPVDSKFADLQAAYAATDPVNKNREKEVFELPEISQDFSNGNLEFTVPNFETALEQNSQIKLWVKPRRNGWEELPVSNCKSSLESLNLKPGNHDFTFRFAPEANSPKNDFPETKSFEINIPQPQKKVEPIRKQNLKKELIAPFETPKTPDVVTEDTTEKVNECLSPTNPENTIETALCNLLCDFDGAIDTLLEKITYKIENNLVYITLPKGYEPLGTLTINPALEGDLISPQIENLDPDILEFLFNLARDVWHENNEKALAEMKAEQEKEQEAQDNELKVKEETNAKQWSKETKERGKLMKTLEIFPQKLSNLLKRIGFEKSLKEVWDNACLEEHKTETRAIFRSLKNSLEKNGIKCVLFLENNSHYGINFTIKHNNKEFCGKIGISNLNGTVGNMQFKENYPTAWQKKLEIIGKGSFSAMIYSSPQIKKWKAETPKERLLSKIRKLTRKGLVLRENVWKKIVAKEPVEIAIYDKTGHLIGTEEKIITLEDLENKEFTDDILIRNPSLNFSGNSKKENSDNDNNFSLEESLQLSLKKKDLKEFSPEITDLVNKHREKIKNAVETIPQVLNFLEIPRNQKYLARRIQATAQLICDNKVGSYGKEPLRNKITQKVLWKLLSKKCGFENWEEVRDFFELHENAPTKFIKEKLSSFQKELFRELAKKGIYISPREEIIASLNELKLLARNNFKIQ